MDISWPELLDQHHRLITLETAIPDAFVVERYTGREAVCEGFRFEVDCLSASAFVELGSLLGRQMTLRLARADGGSRAWHGYVTQTHRLGADGGAARYRLTLDPWTALLRLRRNTLIFQDLDALQILQRLFADYPQACFRFDVTEPLRRRPICTQYRETDFDFCTRLLGEEGLAWRFEHRQDGDGSGEDREDRAGQARHTLVIYDAQADIPASQPETLRFARIDATEAEDAFSRFSERRQITATASTVSSWQHLSLQAVNASRDTGDETLPRLEVFEAGRDGLLADQAAAEQLAGLRLRALRAPARVFVADGSVRSLAEGESFSLSGHPDLSGGTFVVAAIEHEAANNLGSPLARLLDGTDIESGNYRNRLLAVPRDVPLVPVPPRRPTAPTAETAQVVGLENDTLTPTRDHQVRLQFYWQRGVRPCAGGLTDTGSSASPDGHAPGDETSGTWVRVAESVAGPNWGSDFTPRIGAEVLVEYLHGDIDQPVIIAQLYNGLLAPPYAAGVDADANHIGSLSGIQTQALDGSGHNRWVVDDAPGQTRQQLHSDLAASCLSVGYLIDQSGAYRGDLQGQGFHLQTSGWGLLRAPTGLLLSASAKANATSTQLDAQDAVGQLAGALDAAERLGTAAQGRVDTDANAAPRALHAQLDVQQDGRYGGAVGGQNATRPDGAPVERFASPVLLMEAPAPIAWTSPASIVGFAGQTWHLTAQSDAQLAAGATLALAAGQSAGLYAQTGAVNIAAAHGPVSLQAHTGTLEVLADQAVRVTATQERIDVLAQTQIVLQSGACVVTLCDGDITLACPGTFTVKGGEHAFLGGESAELDLALPDGIVQFEAQQSLDFSG